jgi:hypothetical protein
MALHTAQGAADTEDRLRRAEIGLATGGVTGAVASPVIDVAGNIAGHAANHLGDVRRAFGGEPAISDEAARRVARAVTEGPGISAADRDLVSQAGLDFILADQARALPVKR